MISRDNTPHSPKIYLPRTIFQYSFPIILLLFVFGLFVTPSSAFARDCWISPHGTGRHDGTSAENAYAASSGWMRKSADKCWAETSPDGTMYVLEGDYSVKDGTFWNLKITKKQAGASKDPSVRKKLIGLGHVWIEGSRIVPYDRTFKESGETWLEIQKGAHQLHIENFNISRVAFGILADEGGNRDISFKNLSFQDTRQNLVLCGHPDCRDREHCKAVKKDNLSCRIKIEKVNGLRYSKRHIRLSHGIFDVTVLESNADSQSLDGDFAVGFDVENPSHDIVFQDCTAQRNLYTDSSYWNGDGFKSENETEHIRWIRCTSRDNADGGFDLKSPGAVLEKIIATGNGRNIRLWSERESLLTDISLSNAHHFGGIGSPCGLWVQGVASCHGCTIFDNPTQICLEKKDRPSALHLYDSVITARKDETLVTREEGTKLQLTRTEMRQPHPASSTNQAPDQATSPSSASAR